jgi:hypothetical protein
VKTTLRDRLLGGWELLSFSSRDVDTGEVSHPLGEHPHGLILYTDDGYMCAQLARNADGGGYIAYGGRFHIDEDTATVQHDATMSMLPELLRQPQFRQANVDGERLTLTATTTTSVATTHNTLIWRRTRSEISDAPRYS